MQALAILKNAAISAQKARLVIDQIRRLPVYDALNLLKFSPKKMVSFVELENLTAI